MKLIFFDIDGTIITEPEPRYIPESTKRAIAELKANGHLVYVNSGRTMSEIEKRIRVVPFDGWVCGCGTYIEDQGEEIYHSKLSPEVRDEFVTALNEAKVDYVLEGKDDIYYFDDEYRSLIGDFRKSHTGLVKENVRIFKREDRGMNYDKVCLSVRTPGAKPIEFLKDYVSKVEGKKYSEIFEFIDRGEGFFELVPMGNSKAEGIRKLMKKYNVPVEDTISIGDSTNDLPMLTFTGLSICMGNGSEKVKPQVDYVTDSIEKDGLYNAFKHYGLI